MAFCNQDYAEQFQHTLRDRGYSEFVKFTRDALDHWHWEKRLANTLQKVDQPHSPVYFSSRIYPVIYWTRMEINGPEPLRFEVSMAFKDIETKIAWMLTHG